MKLVYPCVVRGFHVYRVYWEPVVGELTTEPETGGEKKSKHCVAVKKDKITHQTYTQRHIQTGQILHCSWRGNNLQDYRQKTAIYVVKR